MSGLHLHPLRVFTMIGLLVLCGATAAADQPKTTVDYKIGPDDVLSINLFDQDPKYSSDVRVRPDGKITLALLDDVEARGLTPMELKAALTAAYSKYFNEPVVYVTAKEVRSRKVYITGEILRPAAYSLNDAMNLVQLISQAGGFQPWANKKEIVLIRKDPRPDEKDGRVFFDYTKLFKRGSVAIPELRPGDQVVVK
ncbi:MAG: polysaccharide biosynthesis/export family protein [Acidobacteriota bacterium]